MYFLRVFLCLAMVLLGTSLYADNPASVSFINDLLAPGTVQIGDFAEGGVVFWLTPDRKHGLVAAVEDQDGGSGVRWDNTGGVTGAKADSLVIGADTETAGQLNTDLIVASQGVATYAAKVADDYSNTVNGVTYSDWYLPSLVELALMFIKRTTINATATANGGTAFVATSYWSSLENDTTTAWTESFSAVTGGLQATETKTTMRRVRAIRAF